MKLWAGEQLGRSEGALGGSIIDPSDGLRCGCDKHGLG